jgi:putative oxidoreductase
MSSRPSVRHFLFDCGTRDAVASNGLAALRLGLGLAMLLGHGLGKLRGFGQMKDGFQVPEVAPLSLMSPQVALLAVIAAEVGAAALLVVGLMTRPAAFVLGFTMAVAAFGAHAGDPFAAREPALLYLFGCVALVLGGAGAWSLDAAVYVERKPKYR